MAKKQIILIPYWIQDVINRNNLQMLDCLNLDKLRAICSVQDLAAFMALQSHFEIFNLPPDFDSIYWIWSDRIGKANPEASSFLANTLAPMSGDASVKRELQERLFSAEARRDQDKDAFITYDLTQDVGGVVIYPGFFTSNRHTALQTGLIEAILKLFYVYDSYHEVAKTPLFKKYLELLAA